MDSCVQSVNSKFELSTLLVFSFSGKLWFFNMNMNFSMKGFVNMNILVFHTPSEIGKKVIRVRYADFLTLQRIFKGTVHMN